MDMVQKMIAIRQDHDETQKDLAKATNWSRPQIQRYETYKSVPTVEYLLAFCQHYAVSADYILGLQRGTKLAAVVGGLRYKFVPEASNIIQGRFAAARECADEQNGAAA